MSNTVDTLTGANATQAATTASSTKKKSSLTINDFYKLLSAEMQYQDPLGSSDSGGSSSSSSSNYINEILQFTMLDQMQSITTAMNMTAASSAVGKSAYYNTTDSNGNAVQQYGTIDAVDMTGDSPQYLINNAWIAQSNITQLSSNAADSTTGSTGSTGSTTQA